MTRRRPHLLLTRRRVMFDSSAYFALADEDDTNHELAQTMFDQCSSMHALLFTTNFLVVETHALLLNRMGRRMASRFLRELDRSTTTVVWVTRRDLARAREIVDTYQDKDFSLTDATSFAVMERLGISHAFTFDRHFAQYGMAVLMPE